MLLKAICSSLCAIGISGAYALPSPVKSTYSVKERHPVPRDFVEVGKPHKDEVIHLQIGLKQQNEGVIESHLLEISDPKHPRHGQHMTAEEIHAIVAPADETVELVNAWLAEHDITNALYSPGKDWISIVVTIEKAEQLLQTKYSVFEHSRDGTTISRTAEWSLPLHLHEHIDVVQPTNSFFRPTAHASLPVLDGGDTGQTWFENEGKAKYDALVSDLRAPINAICNISFTTVACIRTLYGTIGYTPQVPGKNNIGLCNYLNNTNKRSDIYKFLENFRPDADPSYSHEFPIVNIANAKNDQGPYTPAQIASGHNIEGNLDAELIIGITYPTPLTAFSTGGAPPYIPDLTTPTDTNEPYLTFLNYALAQSDLPQVISSSYGDDEQTVPESYAKKACAGFAQLGARGISIIFSSGDFGVGLPHKCFSNTDPSKREFLPVFPGGCPWVTTVGGTKGFSPEVAV
jgi:tripeptidyl-peptidase-1